MRHRDGQAIDNQSVAGAERLLHARASHAKAAKYKGIDKECANDDAHHKNYKATDILEPGVAGQKTCFHHEVLYH